MSSSFEDSFNRDAQEHGFNGDTGGFFTIKEGPNKMRILAEPKIVVSRYNYGVCFKGCGYCDKASLEKAKAEGKDASLSYKYLTWILDYADATVKLYSIPLRIAKQIVALKIDEGGEGYHFDEFPMPYDITITAKNAGTTSVEYTLIPSRKESPLAPEVLEELEKVTPVDRVIDKMKEKQMKKMNMQPSDSIKYPDSVNPDDIPF